MTPTTTATATATPTSAGSHLPLFGAFPGFDSTTDTTSYATRPAKVTTGFGGKLGVERRFMGTNFTLPTMTNPAILSWDFPPAATLAGQYDAQIDAIAKGATKPLWFVPWHKVENGPTCPPPTTSRCSATSPTGSTPTATRWCT